MTRERIEKAIEVINYAIEKNISVKEASVKCGYADTYVKNIKAVVFDKYENGVLDDDLFNLFDNAYKKYKTNSNDDYVENQIINNTSLSGKISVTGSNDEMNIEYKTNNTSNYPKNHVKTLDELLKETKVDLNLWKVKDYLVNKWDVTSWKKDNPETIQNFQVKAKLERKEDNFKFKKAADIFIDMIKNYKAPVFKFEIDNNLKKYSKDNNLLEISIFDLHLGKLCWRGETFENYDVKIASKRFLNSIEILVNRASGFEYSKILFPIGSDFFNSDTISNTTTAGTPQDEDLRWQNTFSKGVKLLVDAINYLKTKNVPIDVLVIPGNHDFSKTYYMGAFLEAWFKDDEQVNINNHASPRKYYKFGKVLLGFTHGNEEKESSLPLIMASDHESKPLWSETIYHEWHVGHIHRHRNVNYTILDKNKNLNEELGVVIRYLSSLTSTEEWHHKKGYIGTTKAADAFIWNDELGMVAHLNSNINLNEE